MLKGSFRFFLCLVLFSAPAFILALDPILTGTGLYALNHPRRNHPPVAEDQYVVAGAGKEKVIILRAKDPDGDRLKYKIVSWPKHGKLKGNLPVVKYLPDAGFFGRDRFTFKAEDRQAKSNLGTVRIEVKAVNHAPHARDQVVKTGSEQPVEITLQATDRDRDKLTFRIVKDPANGTLSGTPPSVTYTSNPGYQGWDRFFFRANDGKVDSNIATVSITVLAVNHAPVAQNQSVSTEEGSPKAIILMATDSDGDHLTYQVVSQPANGILSGTPPEVTYTPHARYQGSDSFTFSAYDGQAYSNAATVSITVAPVADRLSITFPQDGDTVQKSDIRVEGMIVSGSGGETGVVVNGILANIYGDTFVANHVPLVEGANTISATATDTLGNTVTASLAVSALSAKNYIRITASSEVGIAPLETVLTIDSTLDLTNASLESAGPGEVEKLSSSQTEYRVKMAIEGVYHFTAKVADASGAIYEDTIGIIAMASGELESLLVSKWGGMKEALATQDVEAAVQNFSPDAQGNYRDLFMALKDGLSEILQELNAAQINIVGTDGLTAEFELLVMREGTPLSFQLKFKRDSNGLWKIWRF